jgi:hypothetical protein
MVVNGTPWSDSIVFSEGISVPEPSVFALAAAAGLVFFIARHKLASAN